MLGDLLKAVTAPILEGVLRFIPDKNERARAEEMFNTNMLTALTGLVQGQLEINKVEAAHSSIFVSGWRPWVGWVCGFAIAWTYLFCPMLTWMVWLFPDYRTVMDSAPKLDSTGELMTLLLGMLGLGGLRTYEKKLGVERDNMKQKSKSSKS